MNTIETYWEAVMTALQPEVTAVSYDIWFNSLKPLKMTDSDFVLETPDDIHKKTLEERYKNLLESMIAHVTNKKYNIVIQLPNSDSQAIPEKASPVISEASEKHANLIPRYVFKNFVVGNSNQIAYAASVAVAEAPGTTYNPLFLYGGVGLGKTHLMHSIAHYILEQNPSAKVLYASCEKFTNELITAIKENKQDKFKEKYRNIDALLIDDIQFLAKKESTQEEFFHTFNQLWELNKQIILSSDRPPAELKSLEERLRSRFACGLIADIQQPDFETRTAILEKKAELDGTELPKEVFQFIAKTIVSNIRELEGALTRVIAYARLANRKVTLELTEEALKDMASGSENHEISIDYIQNIVSDYYKIKAEELKSKKRSQNIVFPRQIAMYLCRKLLNESLTKIGEQFGGRDHSTIIHGCEKIEDELTKNTNLKRIISELETRIMQN